MALDPKPSNSSIGKNIKILLFTIFFFHLCHSIYIYPNYEKSFLQRLEHFAKGMHKGCMSPTINVVVLKATFLALFGVKEEEEESFFFSIKNNIKSKVRAPSCHHWIYKFKQFFAKEFVQKLYRLNNSIPCLDHVKLSYKVHHGLLGLYINWELKLDTSWLLGFGTLRMLSRWSTNLVTCLLFSSFVQWIYFHLFIPQTKQKKKI